MRRRPIWTTQCVCVPVSVGWLINCSYLHDYRHQGWSAAAHGRVWWKTVLRRCRVREDKSSWIRSSCNPSNREREWFGGGKGVRRERRLKLGWLWHIVIVWTWWSFLHAGRRQRGKQRVGIHVDHHGGFSMHVLRHICFSLCWKLTLTHKYMCFSGQVRSCKGFWRVPAWLECHKYADVAAGDMYA